MYAYMYMSTKINSNPEDLKILEMKKHNVVKCYVHIINLFCHGLKQFYIKFIYKLLEKYVKPSFFDFINLLFFQQKYEPKNN